jgi:hypothetical protein
MAWPRLSASAVVRITVAATAFTIATLCAIGLNAGWAIEDGACPASTVRWLLLSGFGVACAMLAGTFSSSAALGVGILVALAAQFVAGTFALDQACPEVDGTLMASIARAYCIIAVVCATILAAALTIGAAVQSSTEPPAPPAAETYFSASQSACSVTAVQVTVT